MGTPYADLCDESAESVIRLQDDLDAARAELTQLRTENERLSEILRAERESHAKTREGLYATDMERCVAQVQRDQLRTEARTAVAVEQSLGRQVALAHETLRLLLHTGTDGVVGMCTDLHCEEVLRDRHPDLFDGGSDG